MQLAANASHRRPILVVAAFGHHQQRLGNVLMSAMSKSMSLGDAGWGWIRAIRGIGHSIALTRHRVTSRGGSFHTGPSRRLYAPDLAGRQAVIVAVDDDLDLALRVRPDRARRRRLTP